MRGAASDLAVRRATPTDLAPIDALFARSYPALLKHDYPPSVLVTAIPLIARAKPALLASGRYFAVLDGEGRIVGAGGWSGRGAAEIRHVVSDHRRQRQGIGRALLTRILADAVAAGASQARCLATRTAVPFYNAMGFSPRGATEIPLRPGIVFPAVEMHRPLAAGDAGRQG